MMGARDDQVEAFWQAARRGVYGPPEWKGRLGREEAYGVQLGMLERYVRAGDRHAGWKVGLTAKAMQAQQGVHEPVFGFLLASGERPSGTRFGFADLIRPGFENELCLTVGRTLRGPGITTEQAAAALSGMAPALEIIERRGDFAGDLNLALADNAQQKAFVTGAATPVPPGFDLAAVSVDIIVNGAHAERAMGSEVLGTPAASVAWLANKLAEFDRALEAGMRVMSGSFTRQYELTAGDRIQARFTPVGAVLADFA
ncbi:MAG TPA: fumarylacetoacetate hydrolase family protein [Candidatus Limnocylindria bacterium]|nr:fumarylacetoacetate hydrolase family protein [Candidatus Limnocylindria bacterium]